MGWHWVCECVPQVVYFPSMTENALCVHLHGRFVQCGCFMICYELFFKITKCFSCGCWILFMYFERMLYFHWIKCSVMQIVDVWSQDAWFYYDLNLVVDIMTCDEWYYFDDNVLIFFDACICKVTLCFPGHDDCIVMVVLKLERWMWMYEIVFNGD